MFILRKNKKYEIWPKIYLKKQGNIKNATYFRDDFLLNVYVYLDSRDQKAREKKIARALDV